MNACASVNTFITEYIKTYTGPVADTHPSHNHIGIFGKIANVLEKKKNRIGNVNQQHYFFTC